MVLAQGNLIRNKPLYGQVALITGASRGIGAGIAKELAMQGATVVINYLSNRECAEIIVDEITHNHGGVSAVQADVSKMEDIHQLYEQVMDEYGKIDILVNNAGITQDARLLNMTVVQWDEVIRTNLTGMFHLTKKVLPGMIQRNFGRIINISSIIAQSGGYGQTNYSAAKAGIIGFTKSLSLETARHNITVNAVCPGFIATDMVAAVSDKVKDKIKAKIPMGRFGEPAEVAKTVRFLVVDGNYITGQCININGGMYM